MHRDPYKILQVSPQAETTIIDAAFRTLIWREEYRDRSDHESASRLLRLIDAYDTLSDPAARAEYDQQRSDVKDDSSDCRIAGPGTLFVLKPIPEVHGPLPQSLPETSAHRPSDISGTHTPAEIVESGS